MKTELTSTLSPEEKAKLAALKEQEKELKGNIERQTDVVYKLGGERERLQSLLEDNLMKRQQELQGLAPTANEDDDDGVFGPHQPTLRDPPHGENINVELVLQVTDVTNGEKSANEEEATSTLASTQQGRGISSQVAAVNATAKIKCGAVRNQLVLQTKTAINTPDENKFFDLGREQDICTLPSRRLSFIREGLSVLEGLTAMVCRLGDSSSGMFP